MVQMALGQTDALDKSLGEHSCPSGPLSSPVMGMHLVSCKGTSSSGFGVRQRETEESGRQA